MHGCITDRAWLTYQLQPTLPRTALRANGVLGMNEILTLVQTWSRRARLQRSVAGLLGGLAIGLFLAVIIAIAARIWPLMSTAALVALALMCALSGTLLALGWPWLRHWRTSPLAWARRFDRQFGLRQRISTALEVDAGTLAIKSTALRTQQQHDALRMAESVDARKQLPFKLSLRDGLIALGLALALALAIALPNPQQQVLAQKVEFRENLAQQIKQIEEAKRAIEQSQSLTDAQKKQALQALNDAQQALADPNATPEQALAALNDTQSKLDALRDQSAEQLGQDLQQAGNAMSADELTNALANSLGKQEFGKAAQQLRSLSTKDGQTLSQDEMQRVANQLDQMARGVQQSDAAMAQQLRSAAQQMREGNAEQARQSLNQAASGLDKAGDAQQVQQSLNQAQARAETARQSVAQSSRTAQNKQQQAGQPNGQQQQGQNGQQGQQGQSGQANQSSNSEQSGQSQSGQPGQNGESSSAGQQGGAAGQTGEADGQNSSSQNGQAQGQSGGTAQGASDQSGHSEDSGSESSVYAPSRVNAQGKQVVLEDNQGQTASDPSGRQNTAPGGNSSVPYQNVYGDYSKAADEALKSDEVPAGLRDYVRDYFSSLDPKQGK